MSDEQTIESIRERNEERRAIWRVDDGGCEGAAAEYLNEAAADIDFLLSEIEARDAEIERLRNEALDHALLFIAISDNLPEGFAADDLASESRLEELAEFYIQGELRSR